MAPYVWGESDKVYYTSGITVNPFYVQCLLQSHKLATDCQIYAIEHGRRDKYPEASGPFRRQHLAWVVGQTPRAKAPGIFEVTCPWRFNRAAP
eukprot:5131753-Pyramimonas_sp.AAC.1